MLFQASAENSEPTWAVQNATTTPNRPLATETAGMKAKSGRITSASWGSRALAKFAAMTWTLRPMTRPRTISAPSDSVFAEVNTFWIHFPRRRPRVLIQVRTLIIRIATSCWTDRLTA